ncbi:MAG: hypothetical protein A2017_16495 [Lentisphaerae bacterium GWF2_44_16]|nr:MAG: hypothetical protein A2017_16495 [Lentisphaerae bacterium GWF2_44_16]
MKRIIECGLFMGMISVCGQSPSFADSLNPVKNMQADKHEPVTLVKDGKPLATVIINKSPKAFPEEQQLNELAAKEFIENVKLSTGAELPLLGDDKKIKGPLVLIGKSRYTDRLGINADELPAEGFTIKSFPNGIAIVGKNPSVREFQTIKDGQRGTLFGVYDFLERFMGIRWFYPGELGTVIPKKNDLVINLVHYVDFPKMQHRTMYPWQVKGFSQKIDFNLHSWHYRAGRSVPVIGCHSPLRMSVSADEKPECYQLESNGSRNPGIPCYGNPETVKIMIKDLEDYYNKGINSPWKTKTGGLWYPPTETTIYISPPDAMIECQCEYCKALTDSSADRLGRASRIIGTFLNKMATEIKKRWPEKQVFFLPYLNYTMPPQGMQFPDNVIVCICLMGGTANSKEIKTGQLHDALIEGWKKVTGKKILLWEYFCWPAEDTTLPFQYPHVIKNFYKKHDGSIIGSFINGGGTTPNLPGGQWASQHWTLYCWFRLMWNPDFDIDAACDEHAALMYGPAAKPMSEILKILTERWENIPWNSELNTHHVSPSMIHEVTMPADLAANLKKLLEEARTSVKENSIEKQRIDFFGKSLELFFEESDRYHGGNLPTLTIQKISNLPLIDGKLDDICWKETEKQSFKNALPNDPVPIKDRTDTWVQAVWNEKGIAFAFRMNEKEKTEYAAKRHGHDMDLWWDDCMEMFLDVEGKRTNYYHLIINLNSAVYDAYGFDKQWDAKNAQTVALADADGWNIEMFIPFSDFQSVPAPKVGAKWYANFIRNRPKNNGSHIGIPQYQRWSTLGSQRHNDFSAFGLLRFIE